MTFTFLIELKFSKMIILKAIRKVIFHIIKIFSKNQFNFVMFLRM